MPTEIPLNDRLLRSWLRCKRRAWLDQFGNPDQRLWTAHRELQLDEQRRSFSTLFPQKPQRGEAAASAGAPAVVGLRLRGQVGGLAVEAHPPLLQRVQGSSRWGTHAYRPVMFRQGRRTTREHRVVLALWGRLLAGEQQAPVANGLVLNGAGRGLEKETLNLTGSLPRQLDEALERLAGDLARSAPPPLVADRKKCVLCSWRGACDQVAAAEGHLSEVSGIGAKRREMLLELGVDRLEHLAAAEPEQLAEALLVHGEHDPVVPVATARAYAARFPEEVRLIEVPEGDHGLRWPPLRAAAARSEAIDWMMEQLAPNPRGSKWRIRRPPKKGA